MNTGADGGKEKESGTVKKMERTLDLPNNAVAITVSVLRDDGTCFNLGIKCFGTSELQSGKILRFTDDKGGGSDA